MRNRILLRLVFTPLLTAAVLALADPVCARDRTASNNTDLDRVSYAVDGAESSHGRDASMWRVNPEGPQGPMQVSERAAIDVGGGDRFDIAQNRALGRAYLALLHRRYGNWWDAVSAYNWGMGNLDSWIRAGRKSEKLVSAVIVYSRRVLRDSGICRSENCQLLRVDKNGRRFTEWEDSAQLDRLVLPGMEQSGRPLPSLADSGRLLPAMGQSGRRLPGLEQSGRLLPNLQRSGRIAARRLRNG